ncbi:MAG: hypothetical protein ABR564_07170, partial [Candidatus Dormibacteria bacterium]
IPLAVAALGLSGCMDTTIVTQATPPPITGRAPGGHPPGLTGDNLKLSEFTDLVGKGRVQNATLLEVDSFVIGNYTRPDGSTADYNAPYLREGQGDIVKLLLDNKVETTINHQGR